MKTIMLGDDQLEVKDTEYLTDLIGDALNDMGINPTSFAFHIEVEYDDGEEDTESDDKWSVSHYVDEDGHLNVFVKHEDNTEIDLVDEEVSSDDTGNEYGVRFTTQKIESDYKSEAFDRSFPELSDAAGKLMALKAIQDADHGNKIADMLLGPFEK